MAITQTVDLLQLVTDEVSPAIESSWVAVNNPVYVEYLRRDFRFTNASYSGGSFLRMIFASSPIGVVVGHSVYIGFEGVYEGAAIVTDVSGTDVTVDVEVDLTGVIGIDAYMNDNTLRENYFIDLKISEPTNTTALATLKASPNTAGVIGIDISSALQTFVSNTDALVLQVNDTSLQDTNSTIQFVYSVKENWNGSSNSFVLLSDTHYGVNGAFQLQAEYNGNYAEYYLDIYNEYKKIPRDFVRPKYFVGYPFDISFIFPTDLDLVPMISRSEHFSGDVSVGYDVTTVTATNKGSLCRIYPNIDVNISPGDIVTYITHYFESNDAQVSEDLFIDIVYPNCNGIYIEWLGKLGNRSYYLFNDRSEESLNVNAGQTFETPFNRIDTLEERSNFFEKEAAQLFKCGVSGINRNDIDGLKSLLTSVKVSVITPDGAVWKRTGILIAPGTFVIGRLSDNTFNLEFGFAYSKQFNQSA
jgi:hypothetical protein